MDDDSDEQIGGAIKRIKEELQVSKKKPIKPIEIEQSVRAKARIEESEAQRKLLLKHQEEIQKKASQRRSAQLSAIKERAQAIRRVVQKAVVKKAAPVKKIGVHGSSVEVIKQHQSAVVAVKKILKEQSIKRTDAHNKILIEHAHELAGRVPIEQVPRVLKMVTRTNTLAERVKGEIVPASRRMIEDISKLGATNEGGSRVNASMRAKTIKYHADDIAAMRLGQDSSHLGTKPAILKNLTTLGDMRTNTRIKLERDMVISNDGKIRAAAEKVKADTAADNIKTNTSKRDAAVPTPTERLIMQRSGALIDAANSSVVKNDGARAFAGQVKETSRAAASLADTSRNANASAANTHAINERGALATLGDVERAIPTRAISDNAATASDVMKSRNNISESLGHLGKALTDIESKRGLRVTDEQNAITHAQRVSDAELAHAPKVAAKERALAEHDTVVQERIAKERALQREVDKLPELKRLREEARAKLIDNGISDVHQKAMARKAEIEGRLAPDAAARHASAEEALHRTTSNVETLKTLREHTDGDLATLSKVKPELEKHGSGLTERRVKVADELSHANDSIRHTQEGIDGLLNKKGEKLPDLIAVQEHLQAKNKVKETVGDIQPEGRRPFEPTKLEDAATEHVTNKQKAKEKGKVVDSEKGNLASMEQSLKSLKEKLGKLKGDEPLENANASKMKRNLEEGDAALTGKRKTAEEAANKAKGSKEGGGITEENIGKKKAARDENALSEAEKRVIAEHEAKARAAENDKAANEQRRIKENEDVSKSDAAAKDADIRRRAAADEAALQAKNQADAEAAIPHPPDRPPVSGDDIEPTKRNKEEAAGKEVLAGNKEREGTAAKAHSEEEAAAAKRKLEETRPLEEEALKSKKKSQEEHEETLKRKAEAEQKLRDELQTLRDLKAKREEYNKSLKDTSKTPAEVERLKKLIKDHDDLIEAQKAKIKHAGENIGRIKRGLKELPLPEDLVSRIKKLEERLNEHTQIHEQLRSRKAALEKLKSGGRDFFGALGIRTALLNRLSSFLTSILECSLAPQNYPDCNRHNQVFGPGGRPIPPEDISGITINDGYGHDFIVHPIIHTTPKYVPPYPSFVMKNVACVFGSKDYLSGCRAGSKRGDADGEIDGAKDQISENKRILYYTPGDITNIARVDPDLSGQKLAAYCNQIVNAPQMAGKDILSIFPECTVIFNKRGIHRGGATKSPDYFAGYTQGYNTAYIKSYNISWIKSYAETIHVLPPQNKAGYGYGETYGDATPPYGEATPPYGDTTPSYGDTTPPYGDTTPSYGDTTPPYGDTTPSYGDTTPSYGDTTPPYGAFGGGHAKTLQKYGKRLCLPPKYQALLEKIVKRTSCIRDRGEHSAVFL